MFSLPIFNNYIFALSEKYNQKIVVKWIFAVVVLIVVIGVIGYAFYCSSRGGSFAGGIKIGFPKLIDVTFKCKR